MNHSTPKKLKMDQNIISSIPDIEDLPNKHGSKHQEAFVVGSIYNIKNKQWKLIRIRKKHNNLKVRQSTRKAFLELGFQTAAELALMQQRFYITTGSLKLNLILGGGIETGSITELFGEAGSGKTQMCHMLAVTCQLPFEQGGVEGKCLYMDTENSFRTERILAIARRFQLDPDEVMSKISYVRVHNSDMQLNLLRDVKRMMSESRFALMIVDSATAYFRSEYLGVGELQPRQSKLRKFMSGLRELVNSVAVVITNQVYIRVSEGQVGVNTHVGGNVMAHASDMRLSLHRDVGENRICMIVKSACLPEVQETFAIATDGIRGVRTN